MNSSRSAWSSLRSLARRWAVSHFLEGLLETFDFPAGGGVVGRGVLLFGAEVSEAGLEEVSAAFPAGEAGGVDHGVVGEGGRGNPVVNAGLVEGVDNDRAGDTQGAIGSRVRCTVTDRAQQQWSSSQVMISVVEPWLRAASGRSLTATSH